MSGLGARGPYKRYLRDVEESVPKKTLQRWRNLQTTDSGTTHTELEGRISCQSSKDSSDSSCDDTSIVGDDIHSDSDSNAGDDIHSDSDSNAGDDIHSDSDSIAGDDIHSDSDSNAGDDIHSDSDSNAGDDIHSDSDSNAGDDIHSDSDSNAGDDIHSDSDSTVETNSSLDGNEDFNHRSQQEGNTDVTEEQVSLLIQAFVLRHRLTKDALQDLLQMIDLISPGTLSASSPYIFKKCFEEKSLSCKKHFFCSDCLSYIGAEGEVAINECENCNEPISEQDLLMKGNFFIVLPLTEQLIDLMENQNVEKELTNSTLSRGCMYEALKDDGRIQDGDLTLLWNSDGVPAFKSSGFSVWPIQCIITELSPKCQKKHILMPGLWFGQCKPEMDTFLTPYVEECIKLGTDGFYWQNPNSTEQGQINTHVHTLVCSSDSVARPMIRNCKQYNGQYGCDWCLHPGEYIAKGKGHARVYSHEDLPNPELRNSEQYEECSRQAVESGTPVLGVKGPSVCMLLPNFDVVRGFVPDYLHCVLLGIVRQLTKLWLDSENKDKPWYLSPAKQRVVSARLKEQKPPSEITRTPRSLDSRKYWKGSEWRAFLLFYSLVVLKGILPVVYLNHWFLLVFTIHCLLDKDVSRESANQAGRAICKFVARVEQLYGKENMTFNVHILLHLTDSVRNWGPLWATSSFAFESNNGMIMKLFKGTQSVPFQICNTFCLWKDLSRRAVTTLGDDSILRPLFDKLTDGVVLLKSSFTRCSDTVVTLGAASHQQLTVGERLCIEEAIGHWLNCRVAKYFKRFVLSGVLYTSSRYTRAAKRLNHYFMGNDECFYSIQNLVLVKPDCVCDEGVRCQCSEKAFLIVTKCTTGRPIYVNNNLHISCIHIKIVQNSHRTTAVLPSFVSRKCVCMVSRDVVYLSPLPNPYERD
ncbi:uncharacterized protein LOC144442615 [Glandiceps talaboti]